MTGCNGSTGGQWTVDVPGQVRLGEDGLIVRELDIQAEADQRRDPVTGQDRDRDQLEDLVAVEGTQAIPETETVVTEVTRANGKGVHLAAVIITTHAVTKGDRGPDQIHRLVEVKGTDHQLLTYGAPAKQLYLG